MSRASDAANAVVYATEQVCALYGVQVTREQSRMFTVQGTAGRWRPMFIGQWTDDFGKIHRGGKADLLARPRIENKCAHWPPGSNPNDPPIPLICVPLWIECKSGEGRMSHDQNAFRNWVTKNGDTYLLIHDDVRPLIEWFDSHGVVKRCDDADLKAVTNPVSASDLHSLPCRHCKMPLTEHVGAAHGCPGKRRTVWSPDLKAR